jgi:hypothetical protein
MESLVNMTAKRAKAAEARKPFWRRIKDSVHRRDVYLALIFTLVGWLITIPFSHRDYGVLGYKNSVIKVVDAKNLSKGLTILDAQNQPVLSDVYAVETTIANLGTIPFDASKIRRPVEINFGDGARIVQTRVSEAKDQDVSQFTVERVTESAVKVNWATFDPDQYVKVTSLVSASRHIEPSLSGNIFGVTISVARPGRWTSSGPWANFWSNTVAIGSFLFFAFLTIGLFARAVFDLRQGRRVDAGFELFFALMFLLLTVVFAYKGYEALSKPIVPF